MTVTLQAPDPVAFAPYGVFLEPPRQAGNRALFSDWLAPVPGLAPHYHLNRVAPSRLPFTVEHVERHPHAAQLFLPLGVSQYCVTVMPSDDEGAPNPKRALAFLLPGTLGVAYHPGTWHTGITVLDAEGSFAVMMWRGGEDDDVFATIESLEVAADG